MEKVKVRYRTFQYNKLCRDKTVERSEKIGSKIHFTVLDDNDFDKNLRMKIKEEAEEVALATSRDELITELADVLEVMQALCTLHAVDFEDVVTKQLSIRAERGGFDGRIFITKAEHQEGSWAEKYCAQHSDKYPEIFNI